MSAWQITKAPTPTGNSGHQHSATINNTDRRQSWHIVGNTLGIDLCVDCHGVSARLSVSREVIELALAVFVASEQAGAQDAPKVPA